MSEYQTWRHVKFSYTAGFIWGGMFILYALLLLDKVEEAQFQILSWFMLITIGMFVISVRFVPFGADEAGRPNWDEIISLTIAGFVVNLIIFFMLSVIETITFKFEVLGMSTYELMIGLSAAVNEEVFRWSALRFFGHSQPHTRFLPPTVRGIASSALITGALVNTFWCFFHAKSYVNASLLVWAGLWIAGAVITVFMYLSEDILTAIAIHALWNVAVIVSFSFLGVGM